MPKFIHRLVVVTLCLSALWSLLACSLQPSPPFPSTVKSPAAVTSLPSPTKNSLSVAGTLKTQSGYDQLRFTVRVPSRWGLQGLDSSQIQYFRLWVKGHGIADRVWNDGGFVNVAGSFQGTLNVQQVPKGSNRIVIAQAYNAAQQPIEGATLAAVYTSPTKPGIVTVYLKWSYLPLGLIMERLLDKNGQLANTFDANALQLLLNQLLYGTANPLPNAPFQVHPARLDPDLIANALIASQGVLPDTLPPAWLPVVRNANLVVRNPHNLPLNVPIQLTLNDPVSIPWQLNVGQDMSILSGLPPGQWSLKAKINGLNGGIQDTVTVAVAKDHNIALTTGSAATPWLLPPVLTGITPPMALTATPDGLISWWRAENNGQDSIGVNHGTLLNGATYAVGLAQAFQLDGVNDYINVGLPANLNFKVTDSFSVEAWIDPALNSTDNPIFGSSWAIPGYLLRVSAANKLRFLVIQSGGVYKGAESTVLTPGWHHVVGTWNGATATGLTYVDGVLNSSLVSSGVVANITSTQPFRIGNVQDLGARYQGKIDEVKVYRKALSATEINQSYLNHVVRVQGDGFSAVSANNIPSHGINQTSNAANMTVIRSSGTYGDKSLTLTTAGKTSNVANYVVFPTIEGVIRPFGMAGTSITIAGSGFGPGLSDNTLTINGQPAVVATASNTQLTLQAPAAVSSGPIRVSNAYGMGVGLNFTVLPSGLTAWWQAENNGLDQRNSLPLTLMNTPGFSDGTTQYAADLDGSDDYWQRAAISSTGNLSFCAWIYPRSYAGSASAPNHNPRLLMNYDGVTDFQIILHEDGMLKWGSFISNQGSSTTALPPLNRWTHLGVTRNGTTYNIYYNGVLQTMGGVIPGNSVPVQQAFKLGANITALNAAQTNGYFNGRIDEAMLFNRELSGAEVLAVYNGTR